MALLFVNLMSFTLYVCLVVSLRRLDQFCSMFPVPVSGVNSSVAGSPADLEVPLSRDVWLVRLLVQNGIAMFAMWGTVASHVQLRRRADLPNRGQTERVQQRLAQHLHDRDHILVDFRQFRVRTLPALPGDSLPRHHPLHCRHHQQELGSQQCQRGLHTRPLLDRHDADGVQARLVRVASQTHPPSRHQRLRHAG